MEYLGIVKEVFQPVGVNRREVDEIGFKVYIYDFDDTVFLIEHRNEETTKIHEGSEVILTKDIEVYREEKLVIVRDNCTYKAIRLYNDNKEIV